MSSTHLRVSSISSRTLSRRSSRSPKARYMRAMRSSVFDSDISMLSMNVENSGHSSYALRRVWRSPNFSHAVPKPYHAARLMRASDHENTHGMVRRSSRDLAPKPRFAGREPIGSKPTSVSGVTVENHAAKSGVCSRSRKRSCEAWLSTSAIGLYFSVISVLILSMLGADWSSVAAATDSMWRMPSTGLP